MAAAGAAGRYNRRFTDPDARLTDAAHPQVFQRCRFASADPGASASGSVKLGINGWRLHGDRTGVGRYLYNIIRYWDAEQLHRHGFDAARLYAPRPVTDLPSETALDVAVLRPDSRMLTWENLRFGPSAGEDVLFCPSYSRPVLARGRTVVALHDAMSALYPEFFPGPSRRFYSALYGWSGRHAAHVLALSEACRQDIHRAWDVPLEKVHVVRHAADECFVRVTDAALLSDARVRHVGDRPFFMFVGKSTGRRNLPLLIEAFAEFVRATGLPHHLVLVGRKPDDAAMNEQIHRQRMDGRVTLTGFLPDPELNLLYNVAEALVMPSLYETGSLPIMEAQRVGTPVICLDTPGTREVTGGFAKLIARMESQLLAEAMAELAMSAAQRAQIVAGSLQYSRQFSWRRAADETLAVLAKAGSA